MKINSKFHNLESSFLTTIRPLIKEYNAINLASGYTGFHCSPKLIELVEKHLREGLNRYAMPAGELSLRQQVSDKIASLYDTCYHPETEITITAGASQGIYTAIAALVKEGDEVIIFEPANEHYVPAIEMNGGQVRTIPMSGEQYHIEWELVQQMISSKTRMIIINSPHAPTGWTLSEIDLLRLQKIISGSEIIVLSEETFEHILFDGHLHQSVACFPKLAERSVIVASLGETYHVTGWQIGYCAAPKEIMKEFRQVHEAMMHSVNSPFQMAMADFLSFKEEYTRLSAFYQNKRDKLLHLMEDSAFKPLKCAGSYFQLFDYSQISEEKDREFVIRLIKEKGIATMPISAFMTERQNRHQIRINFAKPDDVLEEAAARLKSL
ncbi:aminotransferase class I/II-fold pyridoxal phosphate-dependent enzyme [Carboxylicivirga mesophila]|uniref:Aminotransferase class I/II-fold pyridoxal phosphate-dependent enzyme n=1 Tax=Carboxylicivirga mesophila TaxID=1166478 RepID=A0ABS5K4J6_9BACT|nr:methionine aminotransferase [Carboxylicivirga mesophila]MBS2209931.1 aminotransferase class I/II-fold pyridoxal phosphate-dependent enzyme [Carboxylicivirga mesophila]